ncbi:hypothetical protein ACU4GA_31335 [Methylobacterium oryzae CBMB20]
MSNVIARTALSGRYRPVSARSGALDQLADPARRSAEPPARLLRRRTGEARGVRHVGRHGRTIQGCRIRRNRVARSRKV